MYTIVVDTSMVTSMRYIRDLNPESEKLLERISYQSKFPQVRDRAKCILLSSKKFPIQELMSIFGVGRKTIYNWLTRWEDQQIRGLYNQKGRGRKPKLNQQQREQVKATVGRWFSSCVSGNSSVTERLTTSHLF